MTHYYIKLFDMFLRVIKLIFTYIEYSSGKGLMSPLVKFRKKKKIVNILAYVDILKYTVGGFGFSSCVIPKHKI